MMPRRTAPILWDEHERDKDGIEHGTGETAIQMDSADSRERDRGFVGTIKQLFREALRCLTRMALVPEPKPQRRGTDGSGSTFKLAARKIFTRLVRMPVIDLYTPELWQWNNPENAYQATEEFHHAEPNHLSPQP